MAESEKVQRGAKQGLMTQQMGFFGRESFRDDNRVHLFHHSGLMLLHPGRIIGERNRGEFRAGNLPIAILGIQGTGRSIHPSAKVRTRSSFGILRLPVGTYRHLHGLSGLQIKVEAAIILIHKIGKDGIFQRNFQTEGTVFLQQTRLLVILFEGIIAIIFQIPGDLRALKLSLDNARPGLEKSGFIIHRLLVLIHRLPALPGLCRRGR